ncbi:MAG: glycosyltransferase [Chitinophagaceae bacterium]|nr:MAG: glycosyltransferase [Chitinophagaceae bacterium]
MRGISVVIPNYNGVGLFPHTLPTVFAALEELTLPWELIVVDDCSTDDSVAWLRERYPDITLLVNPVNSGFSVTVNNGVRAAHYELVLLLNSDVQLTPGYFAPQLRYFDDAQTFGVMGRIVGWDDDIVQDGAKYPYFHGVKIKTSGNYLPVDPAECRGGLLSMYLSGANALVRRDHYWKVGGLNELFSPFYVEDFELSLRAWRMGFQCWYEYDAVCRHRVSTTIRTGARKRFVDIIYNRNKMLLHALHLPRGARYVYFLQLLLETLGRVLTGRWYFVQSLLLLLGRYGQVRRARAKFLQNGGTHLLSVREAADRILQFIKHKQIKKF